MMHWVPAFIFTYCVPSAVFHLDSKYRSRFWLKIWIRGAPLSPLLDFLDLFEDQHFFVVFFLFYLFKWCRVGRGCLDDPSLRFFARRGKMVALRAAVLAYCIFHPSHILSENLSPRQSQIRSPDDVKWLNIKNTCICAMATVFKGTTLNFQKLIGISVITKRKCRNFNPRPTGVFL